MRFESSCDLHDDGTFMFNVGLAKMEKKIVDIQNGGPDFTHDITEMNMAPGEAMRAVGSKREHVWWSW